MARPGALHISYTLFFLAMLEVMVWSLPLVHSAVGGSSSDIRGYLSRELENTNHIDNSLIARQHEELDSLSDSRLADSIGAEEIKQLTKQEKEQMALLSEFIANGYIVRMSPILLHSPVIAVTG